MCASFYDASLVEHAYLVGVLDCRQSVGYGNGGARAHESLKSVLNESFALGVECRCSLVENEYGRILEYGAGYADALSLSARESSAPVADVGVVSLFRLHDEVVGVGYACRLFHLLHCGILYAERDVAKEGVVEEYGLLIDVADELAQVVYAELAHVDAVDEHLAFLNVVVARYEVDEGRLAAAALAYKCYGLALLDDEIDVLQHPLLAILERYVAELNLVLERLDMDGVFGFLDGVFCLEYLVDTLH